MSLEVVIAQIPQILLFIVPGFIVLKIIEVYRPAKAVSEFEATLWSLFYSFITSICVDLLKLIVSSLVKLLQLIKQLSFIAALWDKVLKSQSIKIAAYLVISIAIGWVIVKFSNSTHGNKITKFFNFHMDPSIDVWNKTLKYRNGVWATVITKDRLVYYGALVDFTSNPDDSLKQIVLSHFAFGIRIDDSNSNDATVFTKLAATLKGIPLNDDVCFCYEIENHEDDCNAKVLLNYEDIIAIHLNPGSNQP